AAGHPVLGAGAMAMGVGMPEVEGLGPEVTAATRPVLQDIERAAAGAEGVRLPQFAIVSAGQGHLSKGENDALTESLFQHLKENNIPHVETTGRWKNPDTGKWETERSALIPGMERAQAVHLGDRFNQHSVLTVGGQE